ncbi:MAG: hypothetical protein ABIH21_05865 [Patescibacteria group bacterium]
MKAGNHQDIDKNNEPSGLNLLYPLTDRPGFIFAIVIIDQKHIRRDRFYEIITEHIERLISSFGQSANAQHRFEQFLSALNERITKEVRDGSWSFPIKDLNAVVGVASENRMFLSGTGDLTSLFLHKHTSGKYKIFNLFRSIQTEQALPTWEKTFAVVLDGDLHPGDVFCVSSEELQRAVAQEDLLTILTTLPPQSACAKIRQYFPVNAKTSFIIFQVPDHQQSIIEQARPLSGVSIDRFNETKDQTEKLLEDKKPNVLNWIKCFLKGKKSHKKQQSIITNQKPIILVLRFTTKMFTKIFIVSVGTARSITKKEKRRAMIESVISKFNYLPQTSKYLIIIIFGILFIFAISLSFTSKTQTKTAQVEEYQNQLQSIQRVLDQAEGAIIYKDENQARRLFTQAQSMLIVLPQNTEEEIETAQKLRESITVALDDLRNITTIKEPELIADLASVADGIFGRALIQTSTGIHVFATDKSLYKIDVEQKNISRSAIGGDGVGIASSAGFEGNTVYFIDDRPGLSQYKTDTGTLQATSLVPEQNNTWSDVAIYSDKIYVLEKAGEKSDGQVLTFSKSESSETGYSSASKWISSKRSGFSEAESITIDATVFVLLKNGEIARFVRGSQTGWVAEKADPPITDAKSIWTNADSEFVYVLEPAGQRVLVYKKENGQFLVQYRSEQFSGLTDMLIDEKNKTIYLLTGSKVFSIPTQHLN